MNKLKTIIILGGVGFVGKAVVEKYLKNNWQVIVTTRLRDESEAKDKLTLHGFDENLLKRSLSNESLLFAFDVDLTDGKWSQSDNWLRLIDEMNVTTPSILRVINLIGETSKLSSEILKSSIHTLESIFILVRVLKSRSSDMLFVTIGSTAEKKLGKNLSPYEYAKKVVRKKIEESNLCDFHFVAQYIKGRGEQKMKLAAPLLWSKLKFSHRWLFGFSVSVIDVDSLAEVIYHLLEVIKIRPQKQKLIEINVTNGEILFGKMIQNLLPKNKRDIPKAIIPVGLGNLFLWLYATLIPLIKPSDQLARRLASFAKRSLTHPKRQEMLESIKTASEIKKLALDSKNYKVVETSPNLIISDKNNPVIYILIERNSEELEKIIQRASISSD